MIKYFMRQTIYEGFDRESQDRLLALTSKEIIINRLYSVFCVIFYLLFAVTPIYIINARRNSLNLVFMLLSLVLLISLSTVMLIVLLKLSPKSIYFWLCTIRGKVLSKSDFKTIKQADEALYLDISTQECCGYCYSTCFQICKALEKGSIEFLAVKKFSPHDYEDDDGKAFTMHVLYVNNGWAFDVYSSCQYPLGKLHKIYNAKVYKAFSFEEISDKAYEDFVKEQLFELKKWSAVNDCSIFLNCDD